MSQENVDRFVKVTEVFNRFGAAPEAVGPADLESWIGFFDPDVQFVPQLVTRESGRGKGSGIEIHQEAFAVFTLRDGKIVRWEGFVHRDPALEAAGLQE